MHSLRKWFYKPKKEDTSKLAMFYWADEELTMVTTELDSFDGRTDPERCSILVTQLRFCQDKVLSICNDIMDEAIPDLRANRDFRVKFPDDVLHENLAGQLWFGAECLAAGSNIIHREVESASMRPLAKALTRALDNVRCLLREQSLRNVQDYSPKVKDALRIFDRLFAEFELCYVSTMVHIKSAKEYHLQQEIVVLFSETLIRGLQLSLINQEMVDDYDPSLMFTIPRLAIVWGLLVFLDGPFNVDRDSDNMSELFRPFRNLLHKIRDLLWTLTRGELSTLEKMLCSQEEPKIDEKVDNQVLPFPSAEDYVNKVCRNTLDTKQFVQDFYAYNFGIIVDEAGNQVISCNENSKYVLVKEPAVKSGLRLQNLRRRSRNASLDCLESDIGGLVSSSLGTLDHRDSSLSLSDSAQNNEVRNLSQQNRTIVDDNSKIVTNRTGNIAVPRRRNKRHSQCLCPGTGGFSVPAGSAVVPEPQFSQLHSQCSCDLENNSSRRRHGATRAVMQHVMSRLEIMPPEQPAPSYTSSAEVNTGVYQSLSQSLPTHHNYYDVYCDSDALYVPTTSSNFHVLYDLPSDQSPTAAQPRDSNCDNFESPYASSRSERNLNSVRPDSSPLMIPRVKPLDDQSCDATYSSCSSCQSISSVSSTDWNSTSPDTSSYNSDCQDDEEIALALQAAEIASRNKPRSRFKSSSDLLHKLFVCISGVADQLQTNYASDLRNILKSVFDINCTQSSQTNSNSSDVSPSQEEAVSGEAGILHSANAALSEDVLLVRDNNLQVDLLTDPVLNFQALLDDDRDRSSVDSAEEALPDSPTSLTADESPSSPPAWVPDELSSHCMACELPFTILRRRHHCRNCGKLFCSRCSSNLIPLPHFGHLKPVRVCNQCFMYQLTSLVMQSTNA